MRHPFTLSGVTPGYVEELFARFRDNPESVDPSWRAYFQGYLDGGGERDSTSEGLSDGLRLARYIDAYRHRGHLAADVDPLGPGSEREIPDLAIEAAGFDASDLGRSFDLGGELGLTQATLADVRDRLREIYCGTTGWEVEHVRDRDGRQWLRSVIEGATAPLTPAARRRIARRMIEAEEFEHFLKSRFPGVKRFSGEGVDAQFVLLEHMVERAAGLGAEEFVIGPVHRGRLMLMANFFRKPLAAIFAELAGAHAYPEGLGISGDVTYHLGLDADLEIAGRAMRFSMIPNPSHLEAIDPVLMGEARARQVKAGDTDGGRIVPLLYHTDAAVAGQGIVAEVAQLAGLSAYEVGGMIHVVINNRVGFTTDEAEARSSEWCTDFARIIGAPVIHVNADDACAAARAGELAAEFRQRFHRDIVIDFIGYRRLGHNELDEPRFTQPRMYDRIARHPTVRQLVEDNSIDDGLMTRADAEAIAEGARERYGQAFEASAGHRPNRAGHYGGLWRGFRLASEADMHLEPETGVAAERLQDLGNRLCNLPDGFDADEKVLKFLDARRQSIASGRNINWASAEALAFASLLVEGVPVRLSGEDATRGVFTQRHAIVHDRRTGERHVPLAALDPAQAQAELYDSPLSEYAVMGFEYGYSWADPHTLTVWEAQFGDFANGAQIVMDQFLSAAEDKWLRSSGLVLLLPHGLEGGGPEHSSARLERFLALCARGNMQVLYPTTPASCFHALRRQMRRDFRKPLVMMTPKSLLRHRAAVSTLDELDAGTRFRPVLADFRGRPEDTRRIVLCSGKIYYDLAEAAADRDDIGLVRLEQLYPFPAETLSGILQPAHGAEMVWCQEEPRNMGAWSFVEPRLADLLARIDAGHARPVYAGRPENPSPAPTLGDGFRREQKDLVNRGLGQ